VDGIGRSRAHGGVFRTIVPCADLPTCLLVGQHSGETKDGLPCGKSVFRCGRLNAGFAVTGWHSGESPLFAEHFRDDEDHNRAADATACE
jgi:hypothetical protein